MRCQEESWVWNITQVAGRKGRVPLGWWSWQPALVRSQGDPSHRATDLRLGTDSSQLGVSLIKPQKMWGSQDLKLALSDPGLGSFY